MLRDWRISVFIPAVGFVLLLAAAVACFQDNIFRFLINPRTPYQTYSPPPAPGYDTQDAWALWGDGDGAADVFYVHSTTYYSPEEWNAPITDGGSQTLLQRTAVPNEAGPFFNVGALYAPRYRQATLYAFFTHKEDGREARQTAYRDVLRAFDTFVRLRDSERPIVIAGYGQGGLHALRLLQDRFNGRDLMKQLAVAYIIDQAVPLDWPTTLQGDIAPCESPDEVRCLVSWNTHSLGMTRAIERTRERSMVWSYAGRLQSTANRELLCVNPLTWLRDGEYAPPEKHLGGVPATGLQLGDEPVAAPAAFGAQCVDGVLIVDETRKRYLKPRNFFGSKWKIQDYNAFYANIRQNTAERVDALAKLLEEEARRAPPLGEPIEVRESPINKVPD